VKSLIEKFRDKYGAGDVRKYYSKFDEAVQATSPKLDADSLPKPKLNAVAVLKRYLIRQR
jgi:hypothetical protein